MRYLTLGEWIRTGCHCRWFGVRYLKTCVGRA